MLSFVVVDLVDAAQGCIFRSTISNVIVEGTCHLVQRQYDAKTSLVVQHHCMWALWGKLLISKWMVTLSLSNPDPRQCEQRECVAREYNLRLNTPKIGHIVQLNPSIALWVSGNTNYRVISLSRVGFPVGSHMLTSFLGWSKGSKNWFRISIPKFGGWQV